MIHWFTRRGRNGALLLAAPIAVLAFVLLITAGSINSTEIEGNNSESEDGCPDYEEVFSAGDTNGIVYIN